MSAVLCHDDSFPKPLLPLTIAERVATRNAAIRAAYEFAPSAVFDALYKGGHERHQERVDYCVAQALWWAAQAFAEHPELTAAVLSEPFGRVDRVIRGLALVALSVEAIGPSGSGSQSERTIPFADLPGRASRMWSVALAAALEVLQASDHDYPTMAVVANGEAGLHRDLAVALWGGPLSNDGDAPLAVIPLTASVDGYHSWQRPLADALVTALAAHPLHEVPPLLAWVERGTLHDIEAAVPGFTAAEDEDGFGELTQTDCFLLGALYALTHRPPKRPRGDL